MASSRTFVIASLAIAALVGCRSAEKTPPSLSSSGPTPPAEHYAASAYPATVPPSTASTVPPPTASNVSYGIPGPAPSSSGPPAYSYSPQANRPASDTSNAYGPSYSATQYSSPTYSTPTSSSTYSSGYDSYSTGSSSGCKSGCCSH